MLYGFIKKNTPFLCLKNTGCGKAAAARDLNRIGLSEEVRPVHVADGDGCSDAGLEGLVVVGEVLRESQ